MRELLDEINPECQWVFDGEGVATRKYDGSCCMIRDGVLFKRREVQKDAIPPNYFESAQEADINTGKLVGWLPVRECTEDQYHRQAYFNSGGLELEDGTYELIGPMVQKNKECSPDHILVRHGHKKYSDIPTDFIAIREFLKEIDVEGFVWHHPDGRMAKIKKRDFGFKR